MWLAVAFLQKKDLNDLSVQKPQKMNLKYNFA